MIYEIYDKRASEEVCSLYLSFVLTCVVLVTSCPTTSWNTSVPCWKWMEGTSFFPRRKITSYEWEIARVWVSELLCFVTVALILSHLTQAEQYLRVQRRKPVLILVSFSFSSRATIVLECFSGMAFFCLFLLSKKISKWFCLSMTLFFFNPKHFQQACEITVALT